MSFPSLKISVEDIKCKCCTGSPVKNDYKVYFDKNKNKFIASQNPVSDSVTRQITFRLLQSHIRENFKMDMKEIPIILSDENLPSLEEVRAIETIAKQKIAPATPRSPY